MLADCAVELDAARLLVYQTAWRRPTRGATSAPTRSRPSCSRRRWRSASPTAACRCFGGRGYAKDSPIQSYFRQVRLWRIGHGTAEIHRWMIARDLLGPVAE